MILVTGGTGFIGSNIVRALAAAGVPLAVCDRHVDDLRLGNIAGARVQEMFGPDSIAAWLDGRRSLDAVIHMGAVSSTTETDVDLVMKTNVVLTLQLMDWCAARRVPFIYASSAQVYGDGSRGFDDDESAAAMDALTTITPYGASKLLLDRLVIRERDAGRSMPPQWTGLRFFNVYGPGEGHKGAMASVVSRTLPDIVAGRPLRLFRSCHPDYADGGQKRDFIYVRDCVDVVRWLLGNPAVSGIFNLGTGEARTWLDLGHAMFKALSRPARITFVDMPAALEGRYQYYTRARMDRLREAGYTKPFTSLEDGIADHVSISLASDHGGQQ